MNESILTILYAWITNGIQFLKELSYFLTQPVILCLVGVVLVYVIADVVRKLVS